MRDRQTLESEIEQLRNALARTQRQLADCRQTRDDGALVDTTSTAYQRAEHTQAEQALVDSEARYRTTIDALSDMLHVVDEDLRLVLMNASGVRWLQELGLSAAPQGRALFEVFPFLPDRIQSEYRAVFASGEPLITEETTQVGGVTYRTETRKIPMLEGERVARVMTIVRDVSEAERAQERLRHAEKMEALGQLAGGVAHDFNNQLAAMLGFSELLCRRLADPELRAYADTIVRAATHSRELTRHLLAFARKSRSRSEPVDVQLVVREVVAVLRRTLSKRIAIQHMPCAASAVTIGDAALLQNAFLNLGINARDAMPEGGELCFSIEVVELDPAVCRAASHRLAPGRFVRVCVADTGLGMSEDTQRRMFEPFFTTKAPGHGTGMGLASVYGTVANHHGAIEVNSALGRGTVFKVYLPVVQAACDSREERETDARPSAARHVLLADSEEAVREMTTAALRYLGYDVTACATGAAAIELYRERWRSIDLVVLDAATPGPDGAGVLQEMAKINPQIKAIVASGWDDEERTGTLLAGGSVLSMPKPFHIHELFSKVTEALRS